MASEWLQIRHKTQVSDTFEIGKLYFKIDRHCFQFLQLGGGNWRILHQMHSLLDTNIRLCCYFYSLQTKSRGPFYLLPASGIACNQALFGGRGFREQRASGREFWRAKRADGACSARRNSRLRHLRIAPNESLESLWKAKAFTNEIFLVIIRSLIIHFSLLSFFTYRKIPVISCPALGPTNWKQQQKNTSGYKPAWIQVPLCWMTVLNRDLLFHYCAILPSMSNTPKVSRSVRGY